MNIYILTTGEYSDISIQGVFSNKEKAEEFKEKFLKGSSYCHSYTRITEYTLDELVNKPFQFIAQSYIDSDDVSIEYGNKSDFKETFVTEFVSPAGSYLRYIRITAFGDTPEQAINRVVEIKTQILSLIKK